MAGNLLQAGYPLTVFNRHPEKAMMLTSKGAQTAATIAEAVEASEVIFIIVSDDTAVRDVFTATNGILSVQLSGRTIINMSTVSPAISKEMAVICKAHGGSYIDAPVSGSVKQATEATLVIMAGGEESAVEDARPILEKLGKLVFFVGATGNGNALKLAVNTFLAIITQGLAETIRFTESMGLSAADFLQVINNSAMASPYLALKGEMAQQENYNAAFILSHIVKDLSLAKQEGLDAPVANAAYETFSAAEPALGQEDLIAIIKHLK